VNSPGYSKLFSSLATGVQQYRHLRAFIAPFTFHVNNFAFSTGYKTGFKPKWVPEGEMVVG